MSKLILNNKKLHIIIIIFILFFSILNLSIIAIGEDQPDLVIDNVDLPEDIMEGKNLEFVVKIKNQGTINVSVGTKIGVALEIDNLIVAENGSWDGLSANSSISINLNWTPKYDDIGLHSLNIEVDYEKLINETEEGENNNFWNLSIEVLEKDTELEILDITCQDNLFINKTAKVYSTIINNGKNSTKLIYAKLNSSEDGDVETVVKQDSILRGETYVFSFNWVPLNFGSQKIKVNVIYDNKTHDFKEKSIFIGIDQLQWWNSSWHYRYFLTVNGSGNFSEFFNFTLFLNDLGVTSQIFENNTIRIVEYNKDGNIVGEIEYYHFNESIGFDPIYNATGVLIWNVTGSAKEKYYYIYFDVTSNLGDRTELIETEDITLSGDAYSDYFELDGWWVEVLQPMNGSYTFIDKPINITISTKAKAENVSAYIFLNENESHNFTINLNNTDNNTLWKYENFYFDEIGNWTILVTCGDWAGYTPEVVENAFYVGNPDIAITYISFTTDWPYTSPKIYKNDTVTITANIIAYNATLEDVVVSISIFDINNNQIVYNQTIDTTIFVDKNNLVSFSWKVNKSGEFNVTVTLDPDNLIDEQNEFNNQIFKIITVFDLPDLAIENIILPTLEINEYDVVEIDVLVSNKGIVNATDYEIGLYYESALKGNMTYSNKVDSKIVSVEKNTSKVFSMYWNSALGGEWLFGAKAIVNETKRDSNIDNNQFFLNKTLKVKSFEKNIPKIENIRVTPSRQEQGLSVDMTAKITDDSGLKSVKIKITDPSNISYNGIMVRTIGDEFKFTFYETLLVGFYRFKIEAEDIMIHSNNATVNGSFEIFKDKTTPVISYFDVQPYVQLINGDVTFTCIATDNVGIKNVTVVIITPENITLIKTMTWSPEGKYIYNDIYDISGKYTFYIEVVDKAGKISTTTNKAFWITSSLDDTDDDGMPDLWEKKYGFDPEDPTDAQNDEDADELTNIKEYQAGTNPTKDISSENTAFRIKDNAWYLAGSIFMFLIILLITILSIYSKRRKSK